MTNIWWIRRDLRLTDNAALHAALEADSVIPLFILNPAFAETTLGELLREIKLDAAERGP